MEAGTLDLAFVSDDRYVANVATVPVFREPMLFVCGAEAQYPQVVDPAQLDATRQIRIPWNPEYDAWHQYWFDARLQPRVFLDKLSFLEEFQIGRAHV